MHSRSIPSSEPDPLAELRQRIAPLVRHATLQGLEPPRSGRVRLVSERALLESVREWTDEALADRTRQTEAHFAALLETRVGEAEERGRLAVLNGLVELADVLDGALAIDGDGSVWARTLGKRLDRVFKECGFERIACTGERFDTTVHESVEERAEAGAEDGTVLAEVARGYRRGEYVLRPARVVVAGGDGGS